MNDLFKERVLIILALLLCIVSGVLGAWDAPQFSAINVVYTDALAVSSSAADTESTAAKPEIRPDSQQDTAAENPVSGSAGQNQTGKININTATQEMLETLPGIGKTFAARIIDYRETYGGFDSIEEIMNISGIGEKRFEALKDLITVD
ncbi:MAG TPA: helix-hairpin-helix domain-containing protein [Candidatus Avimonas sp.]|jgi:comEA protein|nr:helix-hairpin-helix domain-containing protein [Candidatus Avimonas sp.]HQA16499.1 helix-hairpin-helix domain-containing protein [Candidatus Avimonas sp.]HQD38486.1 helix-hairpin-helix domain-containing protein [Candidatus Avimonas sp.]